MAKEKQFQRTGRRPRFNKDRDFGEVMDSLDRYQHLLVGRQHRSRCLFPIGNGAHCNQPAVDGHTIQESILESMATDGHVKSFPRDMSSLKSRLVEHQKAESKTFYEQRRWSTGDVGIKEASVNYFTCRLHDASLFRPIEYSQTDQNEHPLANTPFTAEQHFLLAYRISMMCIELLERLRIMLMSTSENPSRDSRVLLETRRTEELLRTKEREKARFDECYLKGDYDSLIETPISAVVELPLRIAVADMYTFSHNTSMGEVFLTILPCDHSPARQGDSYFHRVFASHTSATESSIPATIDEIKRMMDAASKPYGGQIEFLQQVMTFCRNAFFSFEYDRLPANLRETVEKAVYKVVVRNFPEQFQRYV